ncbi:MAG: insulinase family protein [Robiginitomaculum sp.]|nr:insulinase family protein [Robiginitomaculum sp.]
MRQILFYIGVIFVNLMAALFVSGCADTNSAKDKHEISPQILSEIGDVFDLEKHDWPHNVSDLKPDPRLVFGRLGNGLRYIILPEPDQKGRVAMRLQFNVGANDEVPEQYGIAHFVEHMAFRGFKNPKTQELIKPLQRLGLSFGAGLNAFTGYDATIYQFDFPNNSTNSLNTGLTLFNDISRGLLMSADAFETERGVIIAENEVRNTPQARARQSWQTFQFPDMERFATNIGGTKSSIEALTIEDLRQFYAQHYRPDNALIVISGDVQVPSIERKLKKLFGDWKPVGIDTEKKPEPESEPALEDKPGSVPQTKVDFMAYREPHLSSQLNAVAVLANSRIADSAQHQRTLFLRNIGIKILRRRMAPEITKNTALSWVSVAYHSKLQKDFAWVSFGASQYAEALAFFDTERRRVLEYGFLPSELKQVLHDNRRRLSDNVLADGTYNASVQAYLLVSDFNSGVVMQSPQQKLKQFDRFTKSETLLDYQQAFSHMWSQYQPRIWMQSSTSYSKQREKFVSTLEKAREVKLDPYKDPDHVEFKLPGITSPGTIRSRDRLKKYGIDRVIFENGLRLNYKKTNFKNNQISVKINLGAGFKELAETNPNLRFLIKSLGTADHKAYTKEQLSRIFEGKTTNFSIRVYDDQLILYNNNLTNEDLQPFFEFMTSFLLDVDYQSKYYANQARKKHSRLRRQTNSQPLMKNRMSLHHVLYNADPRFARPAFLSTNTKTKTLLQDTVEPYFKTGTIEIGVSGDFDETKLLAAISNTLAAMPTRAEQFTPYVSKADDLVFTTDNLTQLNYRGGDKQAAFHFCWPITQAFSVPEIERLDLIRDVLMLKTTEAVREKLGKVYTPDTRLRFSDLYENYGFICAGAQVNTDDLLEVEMAVKAVGTALYKGDINKDEFIRAKKPYLARAAEDTKSNIRTSYQLANAQSRPEDITLFYTKLARVKKIKRRSLIELSREIFTPEKRVLIRTIKPAHQGKLKFDHMLKTAKDGDVKAQEKLAAAYLYGRNTKKNPKEAIKWNEAAAKNNSAPAHYNLAKIYGQGKIATKNRAKEIMHLKAAAKLKHKKSQYLLARKYERGFEEFPDVSNEDIMDLYQKSAQQAYVPAQREWARHLAQGSMVERDNQQAMAWVLIAENLGKKSRQSQFLRKLKAELSDDEQQQAQAEADLWLEQHLVDRAPRTRTKGAQKNKQITD